MGRRPTWLEPWYFEGTLPGFDEKECYVLLKDEEVQYVGLALGKQNGLGDNGIGARVSKYWRKNDGSNPERTTQYMPQDGYEDIIAVMAIGFPEEYAFLAAALGIFLIQRIKPKQSTVRGEKGKSLRHRGGNHPAIYGTGLTLDVGEWFE